MYYLVKNAAVGAVGGLLLDDCVFAEETGDFFQYLLVGALLSYHLSDDPALVGGDGRLDVLDGVGELLAVQTADAF